MSNKINQRAICDCENYIYTNFSPPDEYFALRVYGDSMNEAGIYDRSIILVHQQGTANSGDLVVVDLGGETMVKRLKISGSGNKTNYWLMPESTNPKHEPTLANEYDDFKIFGKAVEVRTRFY